MHQTKASWQGVVPEVERPCSETPTISNAGQYHSRADNNCSAPDFWWPSLRVVFTRVFCFIWLYTTWMCWRQRFPRKLLLVPGVTHNAVGSAGITFFSCVSCCIASDVLLLFLLQLCKRHLFCCFMLIDLCVKFENKKKKSRNLESTHSFCFFSDLQAYVSCWNMLCNRVQYHESNHLHYFSCSIGSEQYN